MKAASVKSVKTAADKKDKRGETRLYPSLSDIEGPESTDSSLDSEDVESLSESLHKMEVSSRWRKKERNKYVTKNNAPIVLSTPPPYPGTTPPPGPVPASSSLHPDLWREVRREMQIACPVFIDDQNQRYHEPLDFKVVKSIAESVRINGIKASFTITQIETLQRHCMTPSDWMNLACACLSPGNT